MNRILVTGGSGFVGRHVIDALVTTGHEVHALRRRRGPATTGAAWHRADLLDASQLDSVVARTQPDAAIHLAWIARPRVFWNAVENLAWVEASMRLFRALSSAGCRRLVFASTCAEYDLAAGRCDELGTPLRPNTLYGAAKLATSSTLLAAAESLDLEVAVARIFFPYGAGEPAEKLVSATIRSILKGRRAACTAGTQRRDYLEVTDVASALVALLNSDVQGAVNVGSGHAVPVAQIVTTVGSMLGRPDLVGLGDIPTSPSDPPLIEAATERLRSEVGWEPSVSLDAGLARVIEWWRRDMAAL